MRLTLLTIIMILSGGCLARPVVHKADNATHIKQNQTIKQSVLQTARTGDWLVTRGYHPTDHLVSNSTNIPISHAAIFNLKTEQVIEAEGQGVHVSDLEEFIDKSYRLLVIRPRWQTDQNRLTAWENGMQMVGSDYDFLGTLGFNYPGQYYCSELVVTVYKQWISGKEKFPKVIIPGELYLYGTILYDSLPRDEI